MRTMSQKSERFEPDAELQALLDSMKESMDWEHEQMEKENAA